MSATTTDEARSTEFYASYSQLTTHRACPQRWFYSSVKRYSKVDPDDVKVHLEFGNWWHSLRHADSIERGRKHDSLKLLPRDIQTVDGWPRWHTNVSAPKDTVLDMADQWWGTLTPYMKEVWVEKLGWTDLVEGLRYVDEEWHKMWAQDIEHERPLAVELSWRRVLPAVPQRPGAEPTDPDTVLIGYVDEVYYDARRNVVVARDHKSHNALSTQTTADDMMDSQLQLYAWGANPTVQQWGLGPIRATAYDRIRSVAPRPPTLTTSGKLATRNGEPTISSSDLRTYLEWAGGPDGNGLPWQGAMLPMTAAEKAAEKEGEVVERRFKDGGVYTAEEGIIERLSHPSARSIWFQRTRTPLNANVVRTHLRAASDSAIDMSNSRARAMVTGEAARNMSKDNCRWCDFASLCRAQLIGGADGDYELADHRLKERT